MPHQTLDLVGHVFGRLRVHSRVENAKDRKHSYFWCLCECGTWRPVRADRLLDGHSQSCGCLQREIVAKKAFKHGKAGTRLHQIWISMNARCSLPTAGGYKNYGGRGITVCEKWRDNFQAFYDWAMAHGYKKNLTIERENVNGNYEPSNCCWATAKQQRRNQRPRTHQLYCKRGHLMSDDNVIGPKRRCRACRIERGRISDQKRRLDPERKARIDAQRRERYQQKKTQPST